MIMDVIIIGGKDAEEDEKKTKQKKKEKTKQVVDQARHTSM